jgi:hypothetical protein
MLMESHGSLAGVEEVLAVLVEARTEMETINILEVLEVLDIRRV